MVHINQKIILVIKFLAVLLYFGRSAVYEQGVRTKNNTSEVIKMSKQAEATFEVKTWNEKPYDEMKNGPKLTQAHVEKSYDGDITGRGLLEYLMIHREDGTAQFVGLERIIGSVDGRSGSFVVKHVGSFKNGIAQAKLTIVTDSGTGKLIGIQGEGKFKSGHSRKYLVTIEYQFKK